MNESPIFSKTYDLLLWLTPQTTKFPREHRFGLAEHILRQALDFQEKLLAASLSPAAEKASLLSQADILLAQLRLNLRLCKDLNLFTFNTNIGFRVVISHDFLPARNVVSPAQVCGRLPRRKIGPVSSRLESGFSRSGEYSTCPPPG